MAFKHRKFSYYFPSDTPFEEVISITSVDGVDVPVVSVIPSMDVSKDIPSYDDYKLSTLLNSGIPLNPVSPNILNNNDIVVENEFNQVTSKFEQIESSNIKSE